jgi:hypothetical protein
LTLALVEAGGQADVAIRAAADFVQNRTGAIASRLRAQAIGSVIAAAAMGLVLERILY